MKKLLKNEKGFTIVEGLIILIVFLVIGLVAYIVYKDNHKSVNTTNVSSNYLYIPAWNIKIKLGHANPNLITYTLSKSNSAGPIVQSAALRLRDSDTSDVACRDLAISIVRGKIGNYNAANYGPKITVGSYFYTVLGSPFACGNSKLNSLREQYTGNNPALWSYSAIN